jgi:DNA-binding transcriptional ArsR family regulator
VQKDQDVTLDRVFHALADPTRRALVERLVRGPASVGQLAEPFEMSLTAVMQHLQVLVDAGLVTSQKTGRVRTCTIEPAVVRSAEAWLGLQRTQWERRLDRLDQILTSTPSEGEGHA